MWKELYLSSWELCVCFLLPYSLCRDSSQVFWLQIEISVWQQDADKCWLAVPDYLPAIYFLMSSSGSDNRDSMHKPFWVNRCKLKRKMLFCSSADHVTGIIMNEQWCYWGLDAHLVLIFAWNYPSSHAGSVMLWSHHSICSVDFI